MSRETITILKCDICGKTVPETWNLFPVNIPVEYPDGSIYSRGFDLCRDCMYDMQDVVINHFAKITKDEDEHIHIERMGAKKDED